MKLITEESFDVQCLAEGSEGSKNMYITGIYMQSDKLNRNGRIYPGKILENQMNFYKENYISKNRSLGELNHPAGPTINLDKVSHMIVDMKREGNNFIGKAKLLETPMGIIARKLIEGGANLGVSTRGLGSVKESNGAMVVQEDFVLNTVDIVAQPSAHDAWVNGILEGVEWIFNPKTGNLEEQVTQVAEQIQKEFKSSKKLNEEQILRNWNKFLKAI